MRKTYTIPSLGDHSFMGGTRLDNYIMDKSNGKAWQGTAVYPRLANYMMDKVCELNPMLTKSHTPIRMYSLCIRGWAYGLIINL